MRQDRTWLSAERKATSAGVRSRYSGPPDGLRLRVSRCVYCVAKLGIADLLWEGPRSAVDLAAPTHTGVMETEPRVFPPTRSRSRSAATRPRDVLQQRNRQARLHSSWLVVRSSSCPHPRDTSHEPRATIYFSGPSPISAEDMDTGSAGRRLCREAHHSRWDDDSARQILATCRRAIPDGGKLLIAEMILPGLNEPGFAAASVPSRNTPRCWPQPASA